MSWIIITYLIGVLLTTQTDAQFFDFFGFPPLVQNAKHGNTTRRTKIDSIRTVEGGDSEVKWKNTTISFVYEGLERDETRPSKDKQRKQPTIISPAIYNYNILSSTPKTVRKTTKTSNRRRNNTHFENGNERSRITDSKLKNSNRRIQLSYDVPVAHIDLTKSKQNEIYLQPINNIQEYFYTERPYETTRKHNNYENRVTTQNLYSNPGVRPAIIEKGPPITNSPLTRPYTDLPSIFTEKPSTNRPQRTQRPLTNVLTTTVKTHIVNARPTDAGALVFPHEDEPPEIIRGPDEDFMSEAEKRRHIEVAEKMCDKYKALNTKSIEAIPLLPSPDPVQVNISQCTPTTVPLVVGGTVVTINEFPHMALLGWIKLETAGYSWKCGGSLISDQYILTAAHCSYQERDNTVVSGPPRVVQLGSSYLDDPGALVVRVGAVVRHPKYKFPKSYYDIALLKLVQKVVFSEVIRPACLGVPPPVGEPIIATGWGRTELGGDQSQELRSVSLPIWDIDKCHKVLGTSRRMPEGPTRDSQMCAGDERGGKDTCQGDSGGPAQIQDGCAWRVVAVTSLGRSCGAPNTPGLYAIVHRAFVSAQVFGNGNNRDPDTIDNNNYNRQKHTTSTQSNGSNNRDGSVNGGNNHQINDNNNNRNDNTDHNSYRPYGGRRTTTTTESYSNNDRGGSINSGNNNNHGNNNDYNYDPYGRRRTTTTTESYINHDRGGIINSDDNNNNHRNNNYDTDHNNYDPYGRRRTTTTTESYYNNDRGSIINSGSNNNHRNNNYNNENDNTDDNYRPYEGRRTTTSTESYGNPHHNYYKEPSSFTKRNSQNRRSDDNNNQQDSNNNNRRSDYSTSDRQTSNINRENVHYSDSNNNKREDNNDYYTHNRRGSNNNNHRTSVSSIINGNYYVNSNRRRFEEGSIWFT